MSNDDDDILIVIELVTFRERIQYYWNDKGHVYLPSLARKCYGTTVLLRPEQNSAP